MRVLVVGSGGREHALASKLAKSPSLSALFCAPGNGGTAAVAENLAVDPENVVAVVELAKAHAIELVVVGPEAPLVAGLCDALAAAGILAFGPGKAGARLEGSKAYSKEFMRRHGVPTAAAEIFRDADAAIACARAAGRPLVVKADGLAAGKGVIVASSVEERLVGEEVSYHVVIDGERFVALAAAQDHKRLLDGDRGPNTGGMGAYSPPPVVSGDVERKILERVVRPTLAGLRADGIAYRGALFIGLMIAEGEPSVIEYNARFGDPETEVMLARYRGDLLPLLLGAARGDLRGVNVAWSPPKATRAPTRRAARSVACKKQCASRVSMCCMPARGAKATSS